MQDGPKAVWSFPYIASVAFFLSLKQFIAYCSSKAVVFKFFCPPHFSAGPKYQRRPLPTNARTTVMLNVIRIGWFFNHKQFEEYEKQFYQTKMVNIYFLITNTLNWTWNKL